MGGHIWIESEGLGKGSTVAFIIKLGMCNNNQNEAIMQQLVPRSRPNQGSGDLLIGHRQQLMKDDYGIASSIPHYQRSF